MVRLLTREQINNVISMNEAIKMVEEAFLEIANGTAISPSRPYLQIPEQDGGFLLNIGYLKKMNAVGIKIASSFPLNRNKNLPTVSSTVILHDPETGLPKAILEGGVLTSIKTGAVGGVAAKFLARDDLETILMIGAGEQAKSQLLAINAVKKNVGKMLVASRSLESSKRFVKSMQDMVNISMEVVTNVDQAVKEADLIVTATTSNKPVVNGRNLKPGVHINGIGSFTPDAAEIDPVSFARAGKVFVDNFEALNVGDLLMAFKENVLTNDRVYHLADVIVGRIKGRVKDDEITIFKSVGGAPYDVAVASYVYNKALEKGVGTEIEL